MYISPYTKHICVIPRANIKKKKKKNKEAISVCDMCQEGRKQGNMLDNRQCLRVTGSFQMP